MDGSRKVLFEDKDSILSLVDANGACELRSKHPDEAECIVECHLVSKDDVAHADTPGHFATSGCDILEVSHCWTPEDLRGQGIMSSY